MICSPVFKVVAAANQLVFWSAKMSASVRNVSGALVVTFTPLKFVMFVIVQAPTPIVALRLSMNSRLKIGPSLELVAETVKSTS